MNKQHSLIIEPDAAIAGGEVKAPHEVRQIGEPDLVDLGSLQRHNRQVTLRQGSAFGFHHDLSEWIERRHWAHATNGCVVTGAKVTSRLRTKASRRYSLG